MRTSILALCCLCACATPPPETPEEILTDIERRLLSAEYISIDFDLQALGVVNAKLAGKLVIDAGAVTLSYHGQFDRRELAGRFTADATTMTNRLNEKSSTAPRPKHLKESLLLGLTRMGLLHNLASLQGGGFPDYSDGSIQEQLQMRNLTAGSDKAVVFDLIIGGRHSASGSLWVDGPVPTMRKQTVFFSQGSMEVEEFYRKFELR